MDAPPRRSGRVAALPSRIPPAHARPNRGRDILTLLIEFTQEPEILALALSYLPLKDNSVALRALELVSKRVRAAVRESTAYSSRTPLQFIGLANLPTSPRARFFKCRRATLRLQQVIATGKSAYKLKTGRNGVLETCASVRDAPKALILWWEDAHAAILDGADIELRDNSGQSLLHWAVCLGDFPMVHALLRSGLDPEMRSKPHGPNSPGHRPVDITIPGSRIAQLLREYTDAGWLFG